MKFKHKREIEDKFFEFDKNNFTPTEKYSSTLQRIGLALYYFVNLPAVSSRARERLERGVNCDIQLIPIPEYDYRYGYGDRDYYYYFYLAAFPRYELRKFLFNQKIKLSFSSGSI